MGNTIIIAKKEFTDLSNSNIMLVILFTYIVYILIYVLHFPAIVNSDEVRLGSSVFEVSLNYVFSTFTLYCCFIGVIVGCSSIAFEKHNNALGLLVTKPLYRDTIINGKLIGILAFLILLYTLSMTFYVSGIFIQCGNAIGPDITEYMIRILLILVLSIIYTMVFVSLSILLSTIIKNLALALITSVFTILTAQFMTFDNFMGTISYLLYEWYGIDKDGLSNFLVNLSPTGAMYLMPSHRIFSPLLNINDILSGYSNNILSLIAEVVIFTVLGYIAFLRTDVS